MPTYAKSEDWLHQSALLLQARPSTTKITTRYHLKPARRLPKPAKPTDSSDSATAAPSKPTQPEQKAPSQKEEKPPRGHLVLKTYDPASGVTLKYKTSKAAEVTRLVQMLGSLGKRMAGVSMPDPTAAAPPTATTAAGTGAAAADEGVGGDASPVLGGSGAGAGAVGEGEGGSGVQTPAGGGAGQAAGQGGGGGGKGKKKKGKR